MPQAKIDAGPGDGPALLDWPLLAWTPSRGVVTEDRQVPVALIGEVCGPDPDRAAVAARLCTTAEHVRQALSYLAAQSVAATP